MIILVFDLIISMLIISGISMACVALYARRFVGRVPAATPYMLLILAAAAWAILYALDLMTSSLPLRIFYHNLRFLFLPFLSVLELWLVLTYVKKMEWLRRDWAALILIIPVVSAILAITSPYHNLFRYNFSINATGPVPVLQYSESTFYTFYFVYSFILLVLAIVLLVAETRKKGTLWETQTVLLLLALAIPTVINYVSQEGLTPVPGINMAPVLLWIPAILYTVALFRYQFLDIVPIARSRLIEALSKPVLVLNTEGRIIDMNPAACSLFSITYSSAVGKPIEEIAQDWPDFLSLYKEGIAQKRELVRNRQGVTHYYIGSSEPILTRDGENEGDLIFLQDVTDLKKAETALQQKSHELAERVKELNCLFQIARLVETSPTIDILLAAIADVIPSGWQYPALTCARIVVDGREFISGNYLESNQKQDSVILVGGVSVGKIEIFFHGGVNDLQTEVFLPEEADLLYTIAERIGKVLERDRAEKALRESEEKYRTIIDEMQDMFYRTDLAGKITMISPSAVHLAGYDSIDQLIGQDVNSVYADPAERDKLLAVLREKGSVYSYPANLKTRDGTILSVTTSSHFYRDAEGKILGVEGVIHDITEQRKAEDALRMANKKLSLLSSITRHDIRNQLMALMAFLELSVDSIDKPAELADFLKKNQMIAENIARQITFTKDYEDLGVMAPSWQNVSAGIDKALELLPVINIRIDRETAGLEVFADPLVEKVFYNLIDNALRYGGDTMTMIRITTRAADPSLMLVFEDNGTGIPDRDKKVIFEKGFGKNTGLGLYLSREILSITGITITETGIPGKGARFEMTIPAEGFRFVKPGV